MRQVPSLLKNLHEATQRKHEEHEVGVAFLCVLRVYSVPFVS